MRFRRKESSCLPDRPTAINWGVCPRFSPLIVVASILFGQSVWADSFVFDPTTNGRVVLPSWLPDRPVAIASNHAELSFHIVPVADDDDLAVTAVFVENMGGYLSLYWQPQGGSRQLICANLFENISLPNQRTILINRPTLGGPGKLIISSSSDVLNIKRVRLDWARPGVVRLYDLMPNGALITSAGKVYAPEEVDGSPLTPVADHWDGSVYTTSVTENAERIEQGVQYPVSIPKAVRRVRVEVLVNGLPFGNSVKLWLNGSQVGTLAMEIPELTDPGYFHSRSQGDHYTGWRKGVFLLSAHQVKKGDNVFQFQGPPNTPLAIRDFLLQIQYASD
jgi:hypothetical protein